jgi:hypothetical protein
VVREKPDAATTMGAPHSAFGNADWKGKGRLDSGLLISYSLFLEYQVQRISAPTLLGIYGV